MTMSMIDLLNPWAALPEILLALSITAFVLIDALFGKDRELPLDRLALIAIILPAIATLLQVGSQPQMALYGMYVADGFAHLLKFCSYIAIATTIVYSRAYGIDRGLYRGEFYTLTLFALLGQMVMISAGNLLVVYMGLELMSLALYALAALRRDEGGPTTTSEAAIKYFVLGALASGFLLYGMSMLYGGTGSLSIREIAAAFASADTNHTVLMLGAVFIVAGVGFKFGAVPFHMWIPDVYQGTASSVTLLIAGAPKLAAFAVAFRLLGEGLLPIAAQWQPMLIVLAVLSLILGNVVAIAQTNFKRMLAYSTIGQIGFLMLGLLAGVVDNASDATGQAYGASMFYVIIYVLTTLGTFGVVMLLTRKGFESEQIDDLKGLAKRSPLLAAVMLVLMFSLAGIPPMAGFFAKLAVLQAAINAGHVWLAVVAVMASLIGAFYYLRIVKVMYFDTPHADLDVLPGMDARALLAANGLAVLALGVLPGPLMSACINAVRQALGA